MNFYGQLKDAIAVPSNVEIFVLGDFNSKLGKMAESDLKSFGFNCFTGNHGMGVPVCVMKWEKTFKTFYLNTICLLPTPAFSMLLVILPLLLAGEKTGVLVAAAKRPFQFTLRLTSFCVAVSRNRCLRTQDPILVL